MQFPGRIYGLLGAVVLLGWVYGHGDEDHSSSEGQVAHQDTALPDLDYKFGFIVSGFAASMTLLGCLGLWMYKFIGDSADPLSPSFISAGTAFTSGALLYVGLVHIISHSRDHFLDATWSSGSANLGVLIGFFGGVALIALLLKTSAMLHDRMALPDAVESDRDLIDNKSTFRRISLVSVICIGIHNLGEGLLTFAAGAENVQLGIATGIAIGFHNIVEGVSVAFPVFQATQSKAMSVLVTFLTGCCEPIGALIGYGLLVYNTVISQTLLGVMSAISAGIMVYLVANCTMPTALKHQQRRETTSIAFFAGMFIIAVSVLLEDL